MSSPVSKYSTHQHDNFPAQYRDALRRLTALEAPSGGASFGRTATVVASADLATPPTLTTSGSFTSLFRLFYRKTSNSLQVQLYVKCDGDTAGSFRLDMASPITGQVGDSETVDAGYTGLVTLTGDTSSIGTVGVTDMQVDVDAKRDFGSGNVRVLVAQAYG